MTFHGTGRASPRCGCDGCELAAAGCCSPLTRAAVADLVELRPGTVVLVLGIPALEKLPRAAQAVGPDGRILVAPGCGDAAALARALVPGVQLVGGSLDRIDVPAAAVDFVTSCCTIHRSGDARAVYGEMYRVLKAGGRFVVSDLIAERSVFEPDEDRPVSRGCRRPPPRTEGDYVEAVREAGFRDVTILQRTAAYPLGGVLVSSMVLSGTR